MPARRCPIPSRPAETRSTFSALLTRFPPALRGKAASLVRARLGSALVATGDPIRTSALLRISNMAAAASALAATGPTSEQCSLIDIRPEGINDSIGSSAFSAEARRWANNGLVKVGFDITAEGRTTTIRTIVASPPFIYGAATEKAISQFRYRPVFRPGNTLACIGTVVPVRFRMLG